MIQLDVLLITPPSRLEVYQNLSSDLAAIEPPVWSGLIAEYLTRQNFTVDILDAEAEGLEHQEAAEKIANVDARLNVFVIYGQQPSASTQCLPAGSKTCSMARQLTDRPSLVIGTHPSALPERTLMEEPFDFVCQGEGPLTVAALARALSTGGALSEVPGLWFKDDDGGPVSTGAAPNISDLDGELPRQKWDLLDMGSYRAHNWHCLHDLSSRNNYASLQTSLGCPFKCTFCCINAPFGGPDIRYWSADQIILQVDELVEKYGVKNIKIPDELFVLNRNHVEEICDRLIERDYGLNIWAYICIDCVGFVTSLLNFQKLIVIGLIWCGYTSVDESVHDRELHMFKYDVHNS